VDQTKPVIEMYEHFGKVREINGCAEINDIYEESRASVLPEVSWMVGPIGSGKSVLGSDLCERTNMQLKNYT
jgi:adenylate kinase family enzyme